MEWGETDSAIETTTEIAEHVEAELGEAIHIMLETETDQPSEKMQMCLRIFLLIE